MDFGAFIRSLLWVALRNGFSYYVRILRREGPSAEAEDKHRRGGIVVKLFLDSMFVASLPSHGLSLAHSGVLVLDQTPNRPSYFTLAPSVAAMVWVAAVGVEGVVVISTAEEA